MKTIVIIGDGMADYPVPELDGKTPLMAAETPAMDRIAREGRTGTFQTIESGMPTGSAVANLSVMGYNPRTDFQGRGVLEAASLGVTLAPTDMAARINLICVEDGKVRSHSAGHITNAEAHQLIRDLNIHFHDLPITLVPGLSYRHVLVAPDGHPGVECAPPHDHVGERVQDLLVTPRHPQAGPTADLLNRIILESQGFLRDHPINQQRVAEGKQAANSLWPWSPGVRPQMATFQERFGISGAVITAVDLIKGLGIYAGLDVIEVEGATGLYDTNYEGKADACLGALSDHDFVYVHVEAADEAGHEQDLALKIRCIEDLDRRLVQRVLDGLKARKIEAVVAVLPDHPTPIAHGKHVRDPVPVAVRDPRKLPDTVERFDEESVKAGKLGHMHGAEFIRTVVVGE
ncbi:MAG: cofactor-independent phosphoglycerate mutase [Anaerolineae bacterium]|nr:cofactor-independent phosphoglycerate mutase [Anaerolineae bacterium]